MPSVPIEGGKTAFRSLLWWCWKNFQILARSHLSHFFALFLGVAVVIREWDHLIPIAKFEHFPSRYEVLIVVLTLGTIGGAFWEFFGNKLSMAPQETRFVAAMRTLLIELEKFTYSRGSQTLTPEERLIAFTDGFIAATSEAMCGKKTVHAGFMWHPKDTSVLKLSNWSKDSDYSKDLEIPIPESDEDVTGPAGRAYKKLKVVYMPLRRWQLSWPLDLVQNGKERYKSKSPCEGWVDAPNSPQDLRSVLCLPVALHTGTKQRQSFGVLNYSTRSLDPFVDRDFMMGECFSSILAQATAAAQMQKEAAQRKDTENKPTKGGDIAQTAQH
jgi:hypothetical protein